MASKRSNYGALDAWEDGLIEFQEGKVAINSEIEWTLEAATVRRIIRRDEDELERLKRDIAKRREPVAPSDVYRDMRDHLELDYQDLVKLVAAVRDALDRGDPTSIERGLCAVCDYQTELFPDKGGLDPEVWGDVLG